VSPDWTSIDPSRFDELVLEPRSFDGPHEVAVYWAAPDTGFGEDRVARFAMPGDGATNVVVIPVGQTGSWSGVIGRLRVDPLDDRGVILGDENRYELGRIFAQSSATRTTSAPRASYVDGPRVELLDDRVGPGMDAGGGEPAPDAGSGADAGRGGGNDAGGPTITVPDAGTSSSDSGDSTRNPGLPGAATGDVKVNSPACAAASGDRAAGNVPIVFIALLGLACARRRR
jgi:hypothetical protein